MNRKRVFISIGVILPLLFVIIIISVKAYADSDDWIDVSGSDNGVQEFIKDDIDNDIIILQGEHNDANGNIRYETAGYYLTMKSFPDLSKKMDTGSNEEVFRSKKKINLLTFDDDRQNGDVKSLYYLDRQSFIDAITTSNLTATKLRQMGKKVPVYLHNVFNIYDEDNVRRASNIFGYQEMLIQPGLIYKGITWSEKTISNLQFYYNYRLELFVDQITYKVNYVAVDDNWNKLGTLDTGSDIYSMLGEAYPGNATNYKPPEEYTKGSTTYQATGKWKYGYVDRGKKEENRANNKDEMDGANFLSNAFATDIYVGKMPDADEDGVTIYIQYKNTKNFKLRVVAVDKNDKEIKELAKVDSFKGGKYTFHITEGKRSVYVKETEYKYQGKWYFTYYTKANTLKTQKDVSNYGDAYTIRMTEWPDVKEKSVVTFYLRYDLGEPEITPPPGTTPTPIVTQPPLIPEITPPAASEPIEQEFTKAVPSGKIEADIRGPLGERFTATFGVPTTESIYAQAKAKEYLLGYRFVNKTGVATYAVNVKRTYHLVYQTIDTSIRQEGEESTEPQTKTVTDDVVISQVVSVKRPYSYWEIDYLDYYTINNVRFDNYALPDGTIVITPKSGTYSTPLLSYQNNQNMSYHVIPPSQVSTGVTLNSITLTSEGSDRPIIPYEDFTSYAYDLVGENSVRNDFLSFDGNIVMENGIHTTITSGINTSGIYDCTTYTSDDTLYRSDMVIDEIKENGKYPSAATIYYGSRARVKSSRSDIIGYPIAVNDVTIHTPVICKPIISANNKEYVQLLEPNENCVPLVLDPDNTLNDMTISISNYYLHSEKKGYYTRDFSMVLRDNNLSYIAKQQGVLRNEVQFPFDVYLDIGNDNDTTNDKYIKGGTWMTIGRKTIRIYVPMWTTEGIYTMNFRTVALNCDEDKMIYQEVTANRDLKNYVATSSVNIEVSGRMYGLTIYDISDYPTWNLFRKPKSSYFKKDLSEYQNGTVSNIYSDGNYYNYKVGMKNQYGHETGRLAKYTFPPVNGSHPKYDNVGVVDTGYKVRFSLDTIGNLYGDGWRVFIKPTFYHVNKEGKNRKLVDLYYTEEIYNKSCSLVQMGSSLDEINIKWVQTGDIYFGIPRKELVNTARLRNTTYQSFAFLKDPMYNFMDIRLTNTFRTFINQDYLSFIKTHLSYPDVQALKIDDNSIEKSMQRWYGEYYLPNEVHAVEKGYDVTKYAENHGIDYTEDFWLKDGYIIVNFDIYTVNENGERRLSYVNPEASKRGYCSMWVKEGYVTEKIDNKGNKFEFLPGDVIMYSLSEKMSEDYRSGSIY